LREGEREEMKYTYKCIATCPKRYKMAKCHLDTMNYMLI
jgi:hypothetical protein